MADWLCGEGCWVGLLHGLWTIYLVACAVGHGGNHPQCRENVVAKVVDLALDGLVVLEGLFPCSYLSEGVF